MRRSHLAWSFVVLLWACTAARAEPASSPQRWVAVGRGADGATFVDLSSQSMAGGAARISLIQAIPEGAIIAAPYLRGTLTLVCATRMYIASDLAVGRMDGSELPAGAPPEDPAPIAELNGAEVLVAMLCNGAPPPAGPVYPSAIAAAKAYRAAP